MERRVGLVAGAEVEDTPGGKYSPPAEKYDCSATTSGGGFIRDFGMANVPPPNDDGGSRGHIVAPLLRIIAECIDDTNREQVCRRLAWSPLPTSVGRGGAQGPNYDVLVSYNQHLARAWEQGLTKTLSYDSIY